MRSRLRAERGQTSGEYLGMIVVVAVILAGLAAASPTVGNVVGAGLRRAVCLISRSGSCPDAPSRGGLGSSPIDARPTRAEPTSTPSGFLDSAAHVSGSVATWSNRAAFASYLFAGGVAVTTGPEDPLAYAAGLAGVGFSAGGVAFSGLQFFF